MGNKKEMFFMAKVEKRNVLNEIRSNNMTLQELRFFSIYLSKINARDISTRTVIFPLSDFQKIMEFGKLNMAQLRACTNSLLSKVVNVPNESGYGYTAFQLFKECCINKNEYGEWYIEINAHDKALPLMFDFKGRYFTYELWNALSLKSANQIRMYEILKQYEKVGKREIRVDELRELLGINKNEYTGRTGWSDFKKRILDSCQQALAENTDIRITYEKGKSGAGGKWLTIVFYISKNQNYVDKLTLDNFIDLQPEPDIIDVAIDEDELREEQYGSEQLAIYASACNYEFDKEQIEQISHILTRINIPEDRYGGIVWGRYAYLGEKYSALNVAAKRTNIKNLFKYFLAMLEKDTEQPNI